MHLTTTIYTCIALAISAVAVAGRVLFRARSGANENLLNAIIEQQSPGSGRQYQADRSPGDRPSKMGSPQLSGLEGHLRTAIISAPARERLIKDAIRKTGGNRAAAIRQVLSDLHTEDTRWS